MLRRTESYAGKAQRNITAPHQQKKSVPSSDETQSGTGADRSSPDFIDHSNFTFKKLDEISAIYFKDYCGPTPESNWVIPGVLLVGAYPASQDDEETYELITSILKENVTKFVCLQQEYRDEGVTVEMWRSGNALRPYFHDVRMVVHNKVMFPDLQSFKIVDRDALSFVHFPIRDCGITDDERVLELSRTLVKAISEGEIIYLHCWGGHGRTGTLVCIMLHLMYSLDSVEAMSRCQYVHDLRKCPVVVGSPQTQTQRDQVTRIIRRLMTQTNFHRRTLSDLFSHTGAARLSMLMDESNLKSPRSDATPYSHNAALDKVLDDKDQVGYEYDDRDDHETSEKKEQDEEEDEENKDGILLTPMEYDSIENDATFSYLDDGNSKTAEKDNSNIRRISSNCLHDAVQQHHLKSSYSDAREKTGNFSPEKLAEFTGNSYRSPGQSPLVTVFSPATLNDHHRRLNFGSLDHALRNGEAAHAATSGIIRDNTDEIIIDSASNMAYEQTVKNGNDILNNSNDNSGYNNDSGNGNSNMDSDAHVRMDVEIGTPLTAHTHTHSELPTNIPIGTINSRISSSSDPDSVNAVLECDVGEDSAMCVVMSDADENSNLYVKPISDTGNKDENTEDCIKKDDDHSDNRDAIDFGQNTAPKSETRLLNTVIPLSPIRAGTAIRRGTMDPGSRVYVTSTSTSAMQTYMHLSTDTSMSTSGGAQKCTDTNSVRDTNIFRQVCKETVTETSKCVEKPREMDEQSEKGKGTEDEREKEKEKEKGLKRDAGDNSSSCENLSYPVPVPPPGSSRPSNTVSTSSSSSGASGVTGGVLSGLKSFRSHFGGASVKNNGTNNGNIDNGSNINS